MADLFKDWIASINEKNANVFKDGDVDSLESEYPAFMINRALSQTQDTIAQANMMNVRHDFLSPKMQYDFLMATVPKKKRFAKWAKAEKSEKVDLIKKIFGYSQKKAEIASDIIDDDKIELMKEYVFEGGRKSS